MKFGICHEFWFKALLGVKGLKAKKKEAIRRLGKSNIIRKNECYKDQLECIYQGSITSIENRLSDDFHWCKIKGKYLDGGLNEIMKFKLNY